MKFEQLLDRAQSCSEFAGSFFDYATSKRLMPSPSPAAPSRDGVVPPPPLSSIVPTASVEFFTHLLGEVIRVSQHYQLAESALVSRYESAIAQLHAFCVRYPPGTSTAAELAVEKRSHTHKLLQTFIYLTASLIQLENYAVLCYAGIGKALKKHDKITQTSFRTTFMQVHVNDQTFSTYPRVRRMFACTEKVYRLLITLQPEDFNALKLNSADAARLVELRSVREGVLRRNSENDDGEQARAEAPISSSSEPKAGEKRPLEVEPDRGGEPPATRTRT